MAKKGRGDENRRQCRSGMMPDGDEPGGGREGDVEEYVHCGRRNGSHSSGHAHSYSGRKVHHHDQNEHRDQDHVKTEDSCHQSSQRSNWECAGQLGHGECADQWGHKWHDIPREQAHENGPDGSKFYGGKVDTDTQIYFLEVGTLIGPSGYIEDPEEQRVVCGKSLDETKGSELVMACDPPCSRVLELVLSYVGASELLEFGQRAELRRAQPHSELLAKEPALQSGWVQMSLNACASHVVESFLRALVSHILKVPETSKGDEKRRAENQKAKLLGMLELLSNKLGNSSRWLISNKYGSHVLRALIQLLMGENTDREHDGRSHGRKMKENAFAGLAGKLHYAQKGLGHNRAKLPFSSLLKTLVEKVLESIVPKIAALSMDVFAAPAVRALVLAMDAISGGPNAPSGGARVGNKSMTVLHVAVFILSCGSFELSSSIDGRQLEGIDADYIRDMVRDASGSHVIEALLKTVSDSLFLEIFLRVFRGHLASLAVHPRANFVVQTLVACARHSGQVSMMVEELENHFGQLLLHRRAGVVAALLAACGRYRVKQREACKALSHALSKADSSVFPCSVPPSLASSSPNDLVIKLLWYGDCSYDQGGWKTKKKKRRKMMKKQKIGDDYDAEDEGGLSGGWEDVPRMSVMGCVILQSVFQCPSECCQVFLDGVGRLGPDVLNAAARDPGGSRVVEAYLRSGAPQKSKGKVIAKLKGHFGELSAVPAGSHCVERCYFAGDMKQKEMIAAELAQVQSALSRTSYGSILLSKCSVVEYAAQPKGWQAQQLAKEKSRQVFVDLFRSDGDAVPDGKGKEMQQAEEVQGRDTAQVSSRQMKDGMSRKKGKKSGVDEPEEGGGNGGVDNPRLQEVMSQLGASRKRVDRSMLQPALALKERDCNNQDNGLTSMQDAGLRIVNEDNDNEEVNDLREAEREMERPSSHKDEIDTLFSRKYAKKRAREDAAQPGEEGGHNSGHAATPSKTTSEHPNPKKKHKTKGAASAQQSLEPSISKEGERKEEERDTLRKDCAIDYSMKKILSAIDSLKGGKKRAKEPPMEEGQATPGKKRKTQFVMS